MSFLLQPDDHRLSWQGAVSLNRTDEWVAPWRMPYEDRGLFPPEALQERAAMPAGVRIAFRSDTCAVAGRIEPDPGPALLDLLCDGQLQGSVSLDGKDGFRFEHLPSGDKLIELWLPQYGQFRLRALELVEGATIAPFDDTRPKWITYGSSITHCRAAESPSQTWPAIVARTLGLNLTCLGYGGNCHLDPMIARMIRELPADFLSMKVGINIYGSESLNVRTFRGGIIGFVQTIRDKHPDTPLAVISPIYSPPRETTPNAVGFTLQAMREEVAEAVNALRAHGDRNIHCFDGLKLLGPESTHLIPDQTHPDAEGYKALAQNFLREVAPTLFANNRRG